MSPSAGEPAAAMADTVDAVDLVFANESELLALFETDSFDVACEALRTRCDRA